MSTPELDNQSSSKYANRLTRPQREAIIAACASGIPKSKIAKDFGVRPETISRTLRAVKKVDNPSNPLSSAYKPAMMDNAIKAINRGMTHKRDPYAAANIGVKVMSGIGEFTTANHLKVEGSIALEVSWLPPQQPGQAQIVDAVPVDDDECK